MTAQEATLSKRERDTLARMAVAFEKIDRFMLRLGLQGLQRMTASSAEELLALEQTAHNAALITIERQLNVLRTQVMRYVERDPLFNLEQYRNTINRIWLLSGRARRLVEGGLHPKDPALIEVIGETRRSYEEVHEPLVLQPLGASGWVTDSDYVGITIYFYVDGRPDQIYQASNAKPTAYFGKDPRQLLYNTISDYVQFSIHDMSHGAFEFRRAKLSRDGRLSLHKDLRVKKAPYIGARAYEALSCVDWITLTERLKANEVNPISGGGQQYALITPADYGELIIDEKGARAQAEIIDEKGATLTLEVALRAENNFLIDNLEMLLGRAAVGKTKRQAAQRRLRPDALFGSAWIAGGKLKFFPYTAVYNQAMVLKKRAKQRVNEIHLSLESLRDVSAQDKGGPVDDGAPRVRKRRRMIP